MNCESGLLTRYEGFGAVLCCPRGCVHVQLGATTLTLTEAQYLRFVAMLADSAANFEFYRQSSLRAGSGAIGSAGTDRTESDYPDCQAC